jgi:glucan endo-1,3-beta-D-glucosidase
MHTTVSFLALATAVSATIKGFNYGSTFTDSSAKQQSDFESEFKAAQGLVGASGFTSARLYTMVVCTFLLNPLVLTLMR